MTRPRRKFTKSTLPLAAVESVLIVAPKVRCKNALFVVRSSLRCTDLAHNVVTHPLLLPTFVVAPGNPCGKGCCRASFRVYPPTQSNTDGDAPYIGHILKKPKSIAVELFTDANAFDLTFPENASSDEKALLIGSAMFFNANFFERQK